MELQKYRDGRMWHFPFGDFRKRNGRCTYEVLQKSRKVERSWNLSLWDRTSKLGRTYSAISRKKPYKSGLAGILGSSMWLAWGGVLSFASSGDTLCSRLCLYCGRTWNHGDCGQ